MYTVVYNVDILYLKSLSAGIGTKKAGGVRQEGRIVAISTHHVNDLSQSQSKCYV